MRDPGRAGLDRAVEDMGLGTESSGDKVASTNWIGWGGGALSNHEAGKEKMHTGRRSIWSLACSTHKNYLNGFEWSYGVFPSAT